MRSAAALSLHLLVLCSFCIPTISFSQSGPPEPKAMPRISAVEAESRLTKKIEPVYPQMAKIAHIQGEVVLNVVISPQGKVFDVKVLSGHPILIQAAMDAVNQWEYRPDPAQDNAQAVATIVHVKFKAHADPKAIPYPEDAYDNQEDLCKSLLDLKDFDEAESACAPCLVSQKKWMAETR
jgi:TonB family protein